MDSPTLSRSDTCEIDARDLHELFGEGLRRQVASFKTCNYNLIDVRKQMRAWGAKRTESYLISDKLYEKFVFHYDRSKLEKN